MNLFLFLSQLFEFILKLLDLFFLFFDLLFWRLTFASFHYFFLQNFKVGLFFEVLIQDGLFGGFKAFGLDCRLDNDTLEKVQEHETADLYTIYLAHEILSPEVYITLLSLTSKVSL